MILPRIRVKNTLNDKKMLKKPNHVYHNVYSKLAKWKQQFVLSDISRIVRCDAFDDTMIQVERNTILNLQKPIVTSHELEKHNTA